MRTLQLTLLSLAALVLVGCSTGPGRSPAELSSAYDTPGFAARDFHPMQADLP